MKPWYGSCQGFLFCGMNISFQGIEGSFHHEVAVGFFGQAHEWLGRDHFGEVFDDVAQGRAEYGVVAIENSNVGTIVGNLDHFDRVDVQIVAEVYLSVQQCLLIHPASTIENITEVQSHPMALDQCRMYLRANPTWKRQEVSDTAGAAKWIMEHEAKHVAAIGSAMAADVYGLNVAATSIQHDATNQTRFWVIANHPQTNVMPMGDQCSIRRQSKASISFETSHEAGALADALLSIKSMGWNLSKIESRPVPDVPWRYRFYCDVEIDHDESSNDLDQIKNDLHSQSQLHSPCLLGVYSSWSLNS